MNTEKKIPEPELFTNQIEETIDDLFKPSKKIEIDPLTQEIKEIASEENKIDDEITVELSISSEEDLKSNEKFIEQQEKEVSPELDDVEFDLELELSDEEHPDGSTTKQEYIPDTNEADEIATIESELEQQKQHENTLVSKLEELRQIIYTIEWETTIPEVTKAIEKLQEINLLPEIANNNNIKDIFNDYLEILAKLEANPSTISSNVPVVLKEVIDSIIKTLKNNDTFFNIESLKNKLSKFLTTEDQFIDQKQLEKKEPIDLEENITLVETHGQIEEEIPENYLSDTAKNILKEHLIALQTDINKILPLEALLAKTQGMEKLLRFQQSIRTNLEHEVDKLLSFFFVNDELNLPKPSEKHVYSKEITNKEEKSLTCPFKQVSTFILDNIEIGIPSSEIIYFSKPPWLTKIFIKNKSTISASQLKPWPWSKLSNIFQKTISSFDENKLKNLEFKLINNLANYKLASGKDFYLMLLYDGENSFALKINDSPITINIPQNAKFIPKEPPFEGEIELNNNKIFIITSNSLSKIKE